MTIYTNRLNFNFSNKLKNICKNDISDVLIYQTLFIHENNKVKYITEKYLNYINKNYEQLKNNENPLNEINLFCNIKIEVINNELKLTYIVNNTNYKKIYLENLIENLLNKNYNNVHLIKIIENNKLNDCCIILELIKFLFENNINNLIFQTLLNLFDRQEYIIYLFNNFLINKENIFTNKFINKIKYLKSGGYLLFEYIFDHIKNNKYDTTKFLNFIDEYMKIISLEKTIIYVKLNVILEPPCTAKL